MLLANWKRNLTYVLLHGIFVCKSTFLSFRHPWSPSQSICTLRIGESGRGRTLYGTRLACIHTNFLWVGRPSSYGVWYYLFVDYQRVRGMEILVDHFNTFAVESSLDCYHYFHGMFDATLFQSSDAASIRWDLKRILFILLWHFIQAIPLRYCRFMRISTKKFKTSIKN